MRINDIHDIEKINQEQIEAEEKYHLATEEEKQMFHKGYLLLTRRTKRDLYQLTNVLNDYDIDHLEKESKDTKSALTKMLKKDKNIIVNVYVPINKLTEATILINRIFSNN